MDSSDLHLFYLQLIKTEFNSNNYKIAERLTKCIFIKYLLQIVINGKNHMITAIMCLIDLQGNEYHFDILITIILRKKI